MKHEPDHKLDNLEAELRRALARQEAPEGFEARVRELAAAQPEPARLAWWPRVLSPGGLRWATGVAALVIMIGGATLWERERVRDRAEGEAAKAKLQLALQITSQKLRHIQDKVENGQDNIQSGREN